MAATHLTPEQLTERYLERCKELGVTPNSVLLEEFRVSVPNKYDFSRNFIGDRGMVAVATTISHNLVFTELDARQNGLRNAAILALAKALSSHPCCNKVNVSSNIISQEGGQALLQMLMENPRITDLDISNTRIEPYLRVKIKQQLASNKAEAARTA